MNYVHKTRFALLMVFGHFGAGELFRNHYRALGSLDFFPCLLRQFVRRDFLTIALNHAREHVNPSRAFSCALLSLGFVPAASARGAVGISGCTDNSQLMGLRFQNPA